MELYEMIVTNREGQIGKNSANDLLGEIICPVNEENNRSDIYRFFAIQKVNPPNVTVPENCWADIISLVIPLGGNLTGLFRFPHVGDKVLVGESNGRKYMMGFLPNASVPFNTTHKEEEEVILPSGEKTTKEINVDDTDLITKNAEVFRYKKTGTNVENESTDKKFSEIGFFTETTRWTESSEKHEDGKTYNIDQATALPYVDKIKMSSTGDIETKAQNYNEVCAKRIGLFAGYNDDMDQRKEKQVEIRTQYIKDNKKMDEQPYDANAFPTLPLDHKSEDPAFFSGDIQMRAKERIVLKANQRIEIVVGRSMILIDDTGISLISRKASGSAVNAWDSNVTVSSNDGLSMFGQKVNISSALRFNLSESFGGSITSLGGVLRINGRDVKMSSICKADYLVKGVAASAAFATNIASISMGIDQNRGKSDLGSLAYSIPSYVSMGTGIVGTLVGVNWKFASSKADDDDIAGDMATITDLILTILGVVVMVLDKVFIPNPNMKNGGRDGLTMAVMTAEYGVILSLFIRIMLPCPVWFNRAIYGLTMQGNVYESCADANRYSVNSVDARSPVAGADKTLFRGLWDNFKGQEKWKIGLEVVAALLVVGGSGTGAAFGYLNKSKVDLETRRELELL